MNLDEEWLNFSENIDNHNNMNINNNTNNINNINKFNDNKNNSNHTKLIPKCSEISTPSMQGSVWFFENKRNV